MLGELLHREQWLHEALQAAAIDDAPNAGPVAYSLQLVLIDRGVYTYILVHTYNAVHTRYTWRIVCFSQAILYIKTYCTRIHVLVSRMRRRGRLCDAATRAADVRGRARRVLQRAPRRARRAREADGGGQQGVADAVQNAPRFLRSGNECSRDSQQALHSLVSCYLKTQIFSQLRCVHLRVIADYIRALSKSNKERSEVCLHTPDLTDAFPFFILIYCSNTRICSWCTLYMIDIVNCPRLI